MNRSPRTNSSVRVPHRASRKKIAARRVPARTKTVQAQRPRAVIAPVVPVAEVFQQITAPIESSTLQRRRRNIAPLASFSGATRRFFSTFSSSHASQYSTMKAIDSINSSLHIRRNRGRHFSTSETSSPNHQDAQHTADAQVIDAQVSEPSTFHTTDQSSADVFHTPPPAHDSTAHPSVSPDELERLLKQFQSMESGSQDDAFDMAKKNTSKWQETPTPDGWTPGPNDPTLVMPDAPQAHHARDDIRTDAAPEKPVGEKTKMNFQTETRKMLDIVTNSLYTDKEVFLRELISNASDALEKARYLDSREQLLESGSPLEIRIFIDEGKKTLTLQDTGIGMTRDELVSHLGTIARSGTRQWVQDMKHKTNTDDIIGQFGVGFYSGFMVGKEIEVYSRSGKKTPGSGTTDGQDPTENDFTPEQLAEHRQGHYWVSEGTGEYELANADHVERGTKIVIHLRDEAGHFANRQAIEQILKKYSNFVGFPIYINGLRANTVEAIWTLNKNDVTEEQHAEFYRYLANAYDKPTYRMHFQADVPLQINALFYFPERHMEKYGMGRMEAGTSLYCRKVLIKAKAQGLLPDYLRFVQGVVDSEDIPLNISRENMQDSLLISRISSVLTKRVIKCLQDEAKRDPAKFAKWFQEFGAFIREGICSDFTHKNELARLLRFDSSDPSVTPDNPTSLDDYIARMPPEQNQIYYLLAPNRKTALESPYYEHMKQSGFEVLLLYHPLDDFAMENLREFNRRKLCSAESNSVEQSLAQKQKQLELEKEYADLAEYVKTILHDKVSTVTLTNKVTKAPAFIVDHESSAMRKMMKMMDTQSMLGQSAGMPLQKQNLQINPEHPIFAKVMIVKQGSPTIAQTVVEQVFDNALMAADLLDNPRDMLPRMNNILELALDPTLVQLYEKESKNTQADAAAVVHDLDAETTKSA